MAFGGWEDWETFRKHYLGELSPEAIRRERGKVDFIAGGDESADVVHPGGRCSRLRRTIRLTKAKH